MDYSGSVALNAEIYTTFYAYDALNRPTSKTTPDNSTAKYSYAKNAMLQSETVEVRDSGTEEDAINDITYNAKGQRTDIYYANGSKTKYEYDLKTFRIIRILTTRNNGQEILQDINFTFDAAGNITQQRDDAQQSIYFSNQVVQPLSKYTYDSLYRLKKATGRENSNLNQPSHEDIPIRTPIPDGTSDACRNYTLNYTYDELGNILQIQHIAQNGNWTRDYFYPTNSNKLIGHSGGQTDYTYDEVGNMLSMPHLNNMVWDEDDMLVEADLGGGGMAYYRYDSGDNRVRKVIINGSVKKERLYVGDWVLWQQSINGTVETERETLNITDDEKAFLQLETLTIDNGKAISDPTTNWRYQYDNHLGSACLELDDSANVISYEEYYPFGTTSYRSGKSAAEVSLKRYRYCGKERDEETGLYYYGARFYAAWIGRFISIDPLAEKFPQLTPYNYAGNKPVTHKDLHGLQSDGGDNEVKPYTNPEISKYENNIEKLNGKLENTRNEYIEYYKSIGKISDNSTQSEIKNAFSESNIKEINRLQGLIKKNENFLIGAKALQKQWNKFDRQIESVVNEFNDIAGLVGKNRLDPNLLKALIFSESEMGTSKDYNRLMNYIPENRPEARYQLNIGRVTDATLYGQLMEEYDIPVNWKENYKSLGNKNDIMLAAGALFTKYKYAKNFPNNKSLTKENSWLNAVIAFKGISNEGARKADLVWKLYTTGQHPYTSGFQLFTP